MKKLSCSYAVIALFIGFFGNTTMNAKLVMNRITNAAYSFSVSTPGCPWDLRTWRTDSENGALFNFVHESDATATIASRAVHGGSVESEYQLAMEAFPPLTDVHHEEKETPWGIIDCYYWGSIKEENLYNARMYAIHFNNNTYSTTCACLEESLAQYENTFNTYVESIYLHPAS